MPGFKLGGPVIVATCPGEAKWLDHLLDDRLGIAKPSARMDNLILLSLPAHTWALWQTQQTYFLKSVGKRTQTAFEARHLRKLFHLSSIQAPVGEWQESVGPATAESQLPPCALQELPKCKRILVCQLLYWGYMGLYRAYIRMIEKQMETTKGLYRSP